jgi:uncharacterized protein YsxB (DUF464 family)
MTQVVIYKNKQDFIGFKVAGHSGFAEEGHDIVCAAVSSAAMLVINGICEVLGQDADIDTDQQNANIQFMLKIKNAQASLFIESFNVHISNLCEQYKENIKLRILEV